jgi:hypothetical protein
MVKKATIEVLLVEESAERTKKEIEKEFATSFQKIYTQFHG